MPLSLDCMSRRRARLLIPLVLAAALTACAAGESGTEHAAPSADVSASVEPDESAEPDESVDADADPATPTAPVTVAEELQFSSTTLDGDGFDGADLAGAPSVLWFWAPWCPTCQAEAPEIAEAAAAHPDVTFVGVAAQDEVAAMQGFVDTYHLEGFTHLADTDAVVWARFGVTYQPAFAFIDADGEVDVVSGRLSAADLDERLTAIGAG